MIVSKRNLLFQGGPPKFSLSTPHFSQKLSPRKAEPKKSPKRFCCSWVRCGARGRDLRSSWKNISVIESNSQKAIISWRGRSTRFFLKSPSILVYLPGWWQLKYVLFSSLLGEWSNLTKKNQMGCFNHQLVTISVKKNRWNINGMGKKLDTWIPF